MKRIGYSNTLGIRDVLEITTESETDVAALQGSLMIFLLRTKALSQKTLP